MNQSRSSAFLQALAWSVLEVIVVIWVAVLLDSNWRSTAISAMVLAGLAAVFFFVAPSSSLRALAIGSVVAAGVLWIGVAAVLTAIPDVHNTMSMPRFLSQTAIAMFKSEVSSLLLELIVAFSGAFVGAIAGVRLRSFVVCRASAV